VKLTTSLVISVSPPAISTIVISPTSSSSSSSSEVPVIILMSVEILEVEVLVEVLVLVDVEVLVPPVTFVELPPIVVTPFLPVVDDVEEEPVIEVVVLLPVIDVVVDEVLEVVVVDDDPPGRVLMISLAFSSASLAAFLASTRVLAIFSIRVVCFLMMMTMSPSMSSHSLVTSVRLLVASVRALERLSN